jgi:hypothetical protein
MKSGCMELLQLSFNHLEDEFDKNKGLFNKQLQKGIKHIVCRLQGVSG